MMTRSTNVRTASVHPLHPNTGADYALRLTREARLWQDHAASLSRQREATLAQKALDSVAFSLDVKARALAVPTKLSGTSRHQDALLQLVELSPMRGHRLSVHDDGTAIIVSLCDLALGNVQDKHLPWLRPLLPFGCTLHYLQVSGTEREEGFLGVNVALAHVAAAIERYHRASGDGAHSGNVAEPVLLEDIYLWRDRQEQPHASIPVEPVWSCTGPNWGYAGHGPTDLSLAVLTRYTDTGTAERLCGAFRDSVIACLPYEGGVLRGASVVAWLHRHGV